MATATAKPRKATSTIVGERNQQVLRTAIPLQAEGSARTIPVGTRVRTFSPREDGKIKARVDDPTASKSVNGLIVIASKRSFYATSRGRPTSEEAAVRGNK